MADVKIPKEVFNGLLDYFLNGYSDDAALEDFIKKELLKKQMAILKRENHIEEYYRNKRVDDLYERVYPEEPKEPEESFVQNFQESDAIKNARLKELGLDKYFKWENGKQIKVGHIPTHDEMMEEMNRIMRGNA